jgi:hypothetical protein
MSVVVPGQNRVRMSEMVVANSRSPSGNCNAIDFAPEVRIRCILL